jgi:hypothetical protein
MSGSPGHRGGPPGSEGRGPRVRQTGPVDDPTALAYWTLAIALLGAVTGVAALATEVWGLLLAGPRVKVTVANALSTADGRWYLSVDASNVGRLPVTLLDVGVTFRAEGEWKRAPIAAMPEWMREGPSTPHRLPDAEQVTWLVHPASLAATALAEHRGKDVKGYVRLATGKTVRSRNEIDVVNLASLK